MGESPEMPTGNSYGAQTYQIWVCNLARPVKNYPLESIPWSTKEGL